jgi:hypothetical protein
MEIPVAAFDCYGLLSLYRVRSSIQEGHVLHRLRLTFRVHQDLMPSIQRDRGMVGVTDATLDTNAGIPTHRAPAPSLRLQAAGQDVKKRREKLAAWGFQTIEVTHACTVPVISI